MLIELGQALNLPLPRRFFPPIFGLDSHLLVKTKNSQCGMICGLIVPAPLCILVSINTVRQTINWPTTILVCASSLYMDMKHIYLINFTIVLLLA
jgi:hypothetical protein